MRPAWAWSLSLLAGLALGFAEFVGVGGDSPDIFGARLFSHNLSPVFSIAVALAVWLTYMLRRCAGGPVVGMRPPCCWPSAPAFFFRFAAGISAARL
jgi:hypothetical protein